MPYIPQESREELETRRPLNAGELNYHINSIMENYVKDKGVSYQTFNDIVGCLECVKQEIYRRKVAPYEDIKILENGDISFFK